MTRTFAFLFIATVRAQSPFTNLVTTPDGETVYFTSTLRQIGSTQPEHGKIFRVGPRGLEAIRSVDRIPGAPPPMLSNLYQYSARS
jgi:hypothetical protein